MRRLILVRHGETLWNAEQRLQGHHDVPLSARGVAQARAFSPYARCLAPRLVVSSDLERCKETTRILGFTKFSTDPRLREINMGEWTGRTKPEIVAESPEAYTAWRSGNYCPAEGENWDQFRNRIVDGLFDWLKRADGDVMAVVHSGVVRVALAAFVGLTQDRLAPVGNGAGAILSFADVTSTVAKLEGFNIGTFTQDAQAFATG
jgi:broad specificity phosphatase PhoE